jgi:SecD/SecF fusion protein
VVSLVHDVLVALGAVALSWYVADYLGFLLIQPFKINLGSIAAFLTIIGYSVNDTIVTFDRVREVKGKSPDITEEILNLSVNQTFGRTILTTFTVFLVVLILYVAGGQELHGFAFTLLIGIICGAYSTIYIAAPLLLWFSGGHKLPKASTPARAVAAQPTGTS